MEKLIAFLEKEQQDVTHKMFNDVVDEMEDLTPFDFMGRIRDHDNSLTCLIHESDGTVYLTYPPQYKCRHCGVIYKRHH